MHANETLTGMTSKATAASAVKRAVLRLVQRTLLLILQQRLTATGERCAYSRRLNLDRAWLLAQAGMAPAKNELWRGQLTAQPRLPHAHDVYRCR